MTYSFNLIDQPWIPCAKLDGRMEELSLREALAQAHTLRGVQGDSPLETASLYRLLLAVIHSALRGPKTKSAWVELWNAKQFDVGKFDAYFKKWHTRFDLFGKERPFYQVKRTKDGREKTSNDVMPDISSGSNSTLFDHSVDDEHIILSSAKAARTLLVMQTFSVAGGWGMAPKESSDAPWGRGVIFLTEDDTLFHTLMLNLFKYPPDSDVMASAKDDIPAWESENPFKPKREEPLGYLDFLTWQNRQVSLIPEGEEESPVVKEMVISQGLKLDTSVLDPMKHYRIDEKKGYSFHRFSEERSLWRDSAALFKIHNPTSTRPPLAFYWLAILADNEAIQKHQTYRFMALGMANDKAKIEFYRHEAFPLPLRYLQDDELVTRLSDALTYAENTARALWVAGNRLALLIVAPTTDGKSPKDIGKLTKQDANKLYQHYGAERFFWSRLEVPFYEFLQTMPDNPESALARWKETLYETAWEALKSAERMAGENTKALKAATRADGVLYGELKKLFPELQPQKEATA
jgi:CRISPR system Cascade subunit CasA